MRLNQIGLFAVGVVLASALLWAAEKPNVGELAQELAGERPAVQRTPEQLEAVYLLVLDSLMPDLGSNDAGKRDNAQNRIERIAFQASRPGAEAQRAACAQAIAARLGPAAGPLGRAWLIRQLERIGRGECVPQLAKLLTDPDALARESARRALQKNSAPEADAALRQAIGSAPARAWRVALINALAERREPANLAVLVGEAAAENDDVRTAAVIGLAKLGDAAGLAPIAAAMTRGTPRAKAAATDCYFRLADALAGKGDVRRGSPDPAAKAAALGVYRKMLAAQGHLKCAAVIGIGRAGSPSDLDTLLAAAADPDAKVRGAAVEALRLLEGPGVTAAIVAKVATAEPEMKVSLLRALMGRGEKGTATVFTSAAGDADEAVQVAALAGLGTLGNARAVPLLLKAATGSGPPQEAARQSLQSLSGPDMGGALLGALGDKDAKIRVEAVRALAARTPCRSATSALLKTAEDADAGVCNESLKALGLVGPTAALPGLAALLLKTEDAAFRAEAATAMVSIANRDPDIEGRCKAVLDALARSDGPAKFALLGVLGRIGGQKSLEAVRAALKDQDEKVRDAACRALSEWPDAAAAADLLQLAKSAAGEDRQLQALRAYLRVCAIRSERPAAETAKLLAAGLAAAKRPDEKKLALSAFNEVRDIIALQAVVPCLSDPALTEEAACAAARIGHDIWPNHPEAVKAAMQKVLEVSKNEGFRREAQEALDQAERKLKEAKPKR
jgi:HEAT repeat protein